MLKKIRKLMLNGFSDRPLEQRSAKKNSQQHISTYLAGMSGSQPWLRTGHQMSPRSCYEQNPVVFRCVRYLSEAVASIPWIIETENENQADKIRKSCRQANSFQSLQTLLETLISHYLIYGDCYVELVPYGEQQFDLYSLSPEKIDIAYGDDGWPSAYVYRTNDAIVRYPVRDNKLEDIDALSLLHINSFNAANPVLGFSPLTAARKSIDLLQATADWNHSLLLNSALPSGAIVHHSEHGEELTADQFARLKAELESHFQGASNAGRPMLLEGGLDWRPMAFSPKDMDYLELKNSASRDVALALGIPPMLLGIPGDSTYSNYSEANRVFWRQSVIPLSTKFAGEMAQWLSGHLELDISIELNTDKIDALANDKAAQWKRINTAAFLTDDEKRKLLGFPDLN